MMPIDTYTTVHGEGGLAGWLVLLLALAALAGMLWWNRQEWLSSRRGRVKWLRWTIVAMVASVAWVAYNPVVIRSTTYEGAQQIVVVMDDSLSMELPLLAGSDQWSVVSGQNDGMAAAGGSPTAWMDVWALWTGEGIAGRDTEAGERAWAVAAWLSEADRHAATLRRIEALEEQGIPPGPAEREGVAAYWEWRQRGALDVQHDGVPSMAEFERTVRMARETLAASRAAQEEADRTFWGSDQWSEISGQKSVVSDQQAVPVLTTDHWPLTTAFPPSRRAMAEKLAETLPPGTRVSRAEMPRMTQLVRRIAGALREDTASPVSDVIVFSDGGDESAEALHFTQEGIRFTAIEMGMEETPQPDFAVMDVVAPPVARAGSRAVATATLKTVPGETFTVGLFCQGETLGSVTTNVPTAVRRIAIPYTVSEAGRWPMVVTVEATADTVPDNNAMTFVQVSASRLPEIVMVDDVPDWDSAYLAQAAGRSGLTLRQLHTAGKTPERGTFGSAVPKTAEQWGRYAGVILRGEPFEGVTQEDAQTLYEFVEKQGGTIVIFCGASPGWVPFLASAFGWDLEGERPREPHGMVSGEAVRFPEATCHLGVLAMGMDPDENRLHLESLPRMRHVRTVPPQQITILEDATGRPVASLGFFGRGKVVLLGAEGFAPLRAFDGAEKVDRMLSSLLAEAAIPLFASDEETVARYPLLPLAGRLVWEIEESGQWSVVSDQNAINNPGLEMRYPEFRPERLRHLAAQAQGQSVALRSARQALANIEPALWQKVETRIYRPGRHWLAFALLALAATAHWILRKLGGLTI